jgi:hypothetical protein
MPAEREMARREKALQAIAKARDFEFGTRPAEPLTTIERIARLDKVRYSDGVTARVEYAVRVAAACLVLLEQDIDLVEIEVADV